MKEAAKRMCEALLAAGISAYAPGAHPDQCRAPYAVVRHSGLYATEISRRLCYALIQVHLYVPLDAYETLPALEASAREALRSLASQVRPTGHVTADMIEEDYRAHTRAIEYMVLKPQMHS